MSYRPTHQRVRIEVELTKKDTAILDAATKLSPRFGRNSAVRFEVALFENGTLADVSSIVSTTLTVKPWADRQAAAQMNLVIGAAAIDAGLTQAQWDAGTHQHFVFEFASNLTGIGTGNSSDHWLTLHGIGTDTLVFGSGKIVVYDAGINLASSPSVPAEGGITLTQALALLQSYAKKIGDPGDTITFTNHSGVKRIFGIDDDGGPLDAYETPT